MQNLGLGRWIAERARSAPHRVALVHGDHSWTYREMDARVTRLAHGLVSLGVQRGDRVAWLGPNHPAFLETLFATSTIGAVLAPVNHGLAPSDVAWIVEDAGARTLVGFAGFVFGVPGVQARVAVDGPAEGAVDYEALIGNAPDTPIDVPVGLDDLCMLPYTSGTTGRPKGVMLTHGNITWNAVNLLSSADILSDDVTVAIAPFWRTGGTGVNVLPVLFKGGTVVIPTSPEADEILRLLERHRVTVGFAGPSLLEALPTSDRWPTADLSSVRFFLTGGAPVPERLIHEFRDRGVTFQPGYGLSEAAPLALMLDRDHMLSKVGSAGKPPLFVDTRIVGADGSDAPPGQTGELLVRGPNVMAGYWHRPDATGEVITEEGWLRTGDAARADVEGFIQIVGRVVDAYRCGGELVFPGDAERVLIEHPAVVEAAVVGVTDAHMGQAGVAFVVLAHGAAIDHDDLLERCRFRLSACQMPVRIIEIEALPKNPAGKILRRRLREVAGS
jgi:fatty-acyl-CoA synthase